MCVCVYVCECVCMCVCMCVCVYVCVCVCVVHLLIEYIVLCGIHDVVQNLHTHVHNATKPTCHRPIVGTVWVWLRGVVEGCGLSNSHISQREERSHG